MYKNCVLWDLAVGNYGSVFMIFTELCLNLWFSWIVGLNFIQLPRNYAPLWQHGWHILDSSRAHPPSPRPSEYLMDIEPPKNVQTKGMDPNNTAYVNHFKNINFKQIEIFWERQILLSYFIQINQHSTCSSIITATTTKSLTNFTRLLFFVQLDFLQLHLTKVSQHPFTTSGSVDQRKDSFSSTTCHP